MAETIVSTFLYSFFVLGKTINLLKYGDYPGPSIFNDSDVVETPVNVLTSTYHVIQDGIIPFSAMKIPVDYVFDNRLTNYQTFDLHTMSSGSFEGVPVLFKSEYRTIDRSIKDNAEPIPGWQDKLRRNFTHYVHTRQCGGSFTTLVIFSSSVEGDLQIIRRILTDVMGTSGHIGADIVDLWRRAEKAITESDDVRGQVSIYTPIKQSSNANMSIFEGREETLKKMSEFSNYVLPARPGEFNPALYMSLRPLHDLDEHYEALEKNTLVERYLAEVLQKYNDVDYTQNELSSFYNKEAIRPFVEKLYHVQDTLENVFFHYASMYKDMDIEAFRNALEVYQNGLDNTTENYLAEYRRWYEKIVIGCQNDFLTPTRGSLLVNEDEVIMERASDLAECQDLCVEDKRCRAVGYAENGVECLIYYRSTRSARILFPSTAGVKTYDRRCN